MTPHEGWYQAGGKSPMDHPMDTHARTTLAVGGSPAGGSIAGG
jgi:hypothetical protein